MKVGDLVARKSYNKDIIFKIVSFEEDKDGQKVALLKGIAFRILADAYLDDLEEITTHDLRAIMIDKEVELLLSRKVNQPLERSRRLSRGLAKQETEVKTYGIPGKVLQIDGDREYLNICLDVYAELGIPAAGVAIPEDEQYKEVRGLLEKYNPDILVITGHDSMTGKKGGVENLKNYRNSHNFVKTVKAARKWQPNLDALVIFAGACQSNFEKIISSGANYASSPGRIMIHALDPVFIVEKIACSRIDVVVPIEEVIEQTITGVKGIGGSETRGKFRWAMPLLEINK
ncbi:MAG: sporulation peptidase YabG [Clostridioides sp.]|nr:sporulation peptidase YabG [Clostridioides sp.]